MVIVENLAFAQKYYIRLVVCEIQSPTLQFYGCSQTCNVVKVLP